uniref:Terpene synthase N-terminal domain-containing protein n=1 Tax=Chenopodium quinoa TaxID=63459 RepID=A0A803NE37_CHEQI
MANKSSEGKVDHVEELVMIDAIQRLGLECYFGDDIDRILRKCSETDSEGGGDDLHGVALRFRLLRQGGYNLQADIFEKFIDNNGRFKQELEKDTKGLMSLFEASELGISGDQYFDEASEFTWNLLNTSLEHWAELCNAFLVEARWFASEHLPTTKEYLKNGVVSSGVYVVFATSSQSWVKQKNVKNTNIWINHPRIATMTGTLLRLWDDLGSAKDEDQDGYDGSFVACYMNEYQESSDESAREQVLGMISESMEVPQ